MEEDLISFEPVVELIDLAKMSASTTRGRSGYQLASVDDLSLNRSLDGLTPGTESMAESTTQTSHSVISAVPQPVRDVPSQLSFPIDWTLPGRVLQSQDRTVAGQGHIQRRPVIANFIVSDIDGPSYEIIEAIYQELVPRAGSGIIERRGDAPYTYIHIETDSENETRFLVQAARDLADDLISDKAADTTALFQEPPVGSMENIQVVFDVQKSGARPKLKSIPTKVPKDTGEAVDSEAQLSRTVYRNLKRAVRQQLALAVRVRFGHFILQSYPQGQQAVDYQHFRTMVDGPRVSGYFQAEVSDAHMAKRILETIQRGDGPLLPMNNQACSTAEVMPVYMFEAQWGQGRVEADIEAIPNSASPATGNPQYRVARTRAFLERPNQPEISLTVFSIGRELDWRIEAFRGEEPAGVPAGVYQFLTSGDVRMQGRNFERWPKITLKSNHVIGKALTGITIKSLYQFRWKTTPYIVEVVVNRRWARLKSMKKKPDVDFGITVYGEHWNQGTQSAAQTVGNVWGDELQLLFSDEGNATAAGDERVRRFVDIVQGVRDAIDTVRGEA